MFSTDCKFEHALIAVSHLGDHGLSEEVHPLAKWNDEWDMLQQGGVAVDQKNT